MTETDFKRLSDSFFSHYWRWEVLPEEPYASSCLEECRRRLPHIAEDSWPERFELGGVYVAGRPAEPLTPIRPPVRLEYYEPKVALSEVPFAYPRFSPDWVLQQDADIGIIFKPPGLPTVAPRDQQLYCLARYLEGHFGRKVHLPSRLDTAVRGLLLVSFSERANRWFQRAFDRKLVRKTYACEVSGHLAGPQREVRRPIGRDPRHPVLRRVVEVGGDDAITLLWPLAHYEVRGSARTLVQACPITGRTHQIRLHCQSEGYPIVGDPLYGGVDAPELRLVSAGLAFRHPYNSSDIAFELPLALMPAWLQDSPWQARPVLAPSLWR